MYRSKDLMTEGLTATGLEELHRLLRIIRRADPVQFCGFEVRRAVKQLRRIGRPAALAMARDLRLAQKETPPDWFAVYKPLFVLEALGPAAAAAVPELINALDDTHEINVLIAARALSRIGPLAGRRRRSLRRRSRQCQTQRGGHGLNRGTGHPD